jgi:hypothetical protein
VTKQEAIAKAQERLCYAFKLQCNLATAIFRAHESLLPFARYGAAEASDQVFAVLDAQKALNELECCLDYAERLLKEAK